MDNRIIEFLNSQKTASLCCLDESGQPYCFTCFYAFEEKNRSLLFKSSPESLHVKLLLQNPSAAGTVVAGNVKLSSLKGIQFTGEFTGQKNAAHATTYHKKFPFAFTFKGNVFEVKLLSVKMTDNSVGFARKIIWEESPDNSRFSPIHDQDHA